MLVLYMCMNAEILHVREYEDYLLNTQNQGKTLKYAEMMIAQNPI